MRITCPNCHAQYDVDPAMIPEAGRDVQCSSCAHTWFQTRAVEVEADDMQDDAAAQIAETAEEHAGADDDRLPEEIEAEAAAGAAEDEGETWDEVAPEPEAGDEEPWAEEPEARDTGDFADAGAPEEGAEDKVADGAADGDPLDDDAAEPADDAPGPTGEASPPAEAEEVREDPNDHLRAAMDRPPDDVLEREPVESEAYRATMRDAVSQPGTAPETSSPPDADDGDGETGTTDAPGPVLDREVADILREEAEFEANRRRVDDAPPAFDLQGDLALDEGSPSKALRERLDRMRGDGVPDATVGAGAVAAGVDYPGAGRRDRLPDIEEINSTLRPGSGEREPEAPVSPAEIAATRRSGFRTGFATIVLLTALLVGAYVYAPQIVRAVPASEGAMISFVESANTVRDRIDGLMARAISGINDVVGDGPNGA